MKIDMKVTELKLKREMCRRGEWIHENRAF